MQSYTRAPPQLEDYCGKIVSAAGCLRLLIQAARLTHEENLDCKLNVIYLQTSFKLLEDGCGDDPAHAPTVNTQNGDSLPPLTAGP